MQVFTHEEVDELDREENSNETQPLLNRKPHSNELDAIDENDTIEWASFLTACAANLYEYYDFALLGFFASEIAEALFPSGPGASAIIQLYSLYAVGFIARPFGGIVFGYFGDRYGRGTSLRMAMILMSFPTFLTGCIPSYSLIGWWAPVILLLLRVLQGLSTGGENSSASIYIYETAPKAQRAFWLSIFGICSSGTLIASIMHVIMQNSCTTTQLNTWGWRIPFFMGIGLFLFSFVAKHLLKSTDTFNQLENSPYIHRNPIKYACSHNRSTLLKFLFASSLQHGSSYLIFVFLPSYLSSESLRGAASDGWTDPYAYTINCINSVSFLPLLLVVGYFTDKIGPLPFLCVSVVTVIFVSPFAFYGLATSTSSIMNWLYQFILVISCVPTWGCVFYWYIHELLPDPRTRVTIYGVGYNLGAAMFGGTASLVGTAFVSSSGSVSGMLLTGSWMSVMAVLTIATIGFESFCKGWFMKWNNNGSILNTEGSYDKNRNKIARMKAMETLQGDQFTSTWYLNKTYALDTISEENYDDLCSTTTNDDCDEDSVHNDPKISG